MKVGEGGRRIGEEVEMSLGKGLFAGDGSIINGCSFASFLPLLSLFSFLWRFLFRSGVSSTDWVKLS